MQPEDLLHELKYFEDFLKKIGFKRIEGSVYGFLALSETSLSSEDIQAGLGLSQSAVSNSLKTLTFYKAIDSSEDRERGCRVYEASEDCLSIVSNVFKKRESDFIREYKLMAERVLKVSREKGATENSVRVKRFKSIVSTCELGEVIIKFVYSLDEMGLSQHLPKVTDKLPNVLELVTTNAEKGLDVANKLKGIVGNRMKNYMGKLSGDQHVK
ncbi:MAG: DNA-binding transcriptional regulator GbsR (MarR family) [Bacteriovoracaceae bacterium]|jgi:DNA-binding transcriptional regulator GbsR (MarR family)